MRGEGKEKEWNTALFLRAAAASPALPEAFERWGIPFLDWPLYETGADPEALERAAKQTEGPDAADYLVFGSASAVRAWFSREEEDAGPEEKRTFSKKPVYVCMGQSCGAQLQAMTQNPFLVAEESSVDGILECLRKEEEKES